HLLARPLAARLLAGLLGPANHRTFTEGVEGRDNHRTKASPIGDKKSDCGYAPRDPQHSEETPQRLTPKRGPGLCEHLLEHARFQFSVISSQSSVKASTKSRNSRPRLATDNCN